MYVHFDLLGRKEAEAVVVIVIEGKLVIIRKLFPCLVPLSLQFYQSLVITMLEFKFISFDMNQCNWTNFWISFTYLYIILM